MNSLVADMKDTRYFEMFLFNLIKIETHGLNDFLRFCIRILQRQQSNLTHTHTHECINMHIYKCDYIYNIIYALRNYIYTYYIYNVCAYIERN